MKINYVLAQEEGYEPSWTREDWLTDGDVVLSRDETQITLEELANICDSNVEQDNDCTGFTGQHRILAQLLFNQFGREAATKFMLTLAKYGGLSRTIFVEDLVLSDGIYQELGIEQPWNDFVVNEGVNS
jgi:hypothetical protein